MAKTWVLDTETKGTGAQMVPLEKALRKPGGEPPLNLVQLGRPAPPRAPREPESRQPRRFRIVDVMTRNALVEGIGIRPALELLSGVRSVVDVVVSVWEPALDGWRPLTLAEQRTMWECRGRHTDAPGAQRRDRPRVSRGARTAPPA
jgi:hypothetical protein